MPSHLPTSGLLFNKLLCYSELKMIRIPGKIPITIHPLFWVLAGLIGWFSTESIEGTLIWVLLILISVTIHEFGHALTAMAWGQQVSIELIGFGGLTQRKGERLKLWKEFIIILNGPLAGLLLCLCARVLAIALNKTHPGSPFVNWLVITYFVNLIWTVINLFPVQPLDGGRLLSLLLESIFGLKGIKAALFISILFASGLSLYFFSIQSFLAGSLFFLFAYESWVSWKSSLSISDQDQNFALQELLRNAEQEATLGRQQEALDKFLAIRKAAKSGVLFTSASEKAAELLSVKHEAKAAYEILLPLKQKLSLEGLRLLHQLAYQQGLWNESALLGEKIYQMTPHYEIALMNAVSHSLLGNVRPAVGWLTCAIRDGAPNVPELLARKEFDPIRSDPFFSN